MSERKAKALAFAIALVIAALPASAKTTTTKSKPAPAPKATTWTTTQIQSLITKTLDAYLAVGKFIGPPGPQGPQGQAGAIVSTYPANPSANSNGGSIAGFSQLSASNLNVDQATTTKTLNVSGNAAVTGGITAGSLSTVGTINATNYLQNGAPLTAGASPCGSAGQVQTYGTSTTFACDSNFFYFPDSGLHVTNAINSYALSSTVTSAAGTTGAVLGSTLPSGGGLNDLAYGGSFGSDTSNTTGKISTAWGSSNTVYVGGTHGLSKAIGVESQIGGDSGNTADSVWGFLADTPFSAGLTFTNLWGFYNSTPSVTVSSTNYGFYTEALGGIGVNAYPFWSDEQGVFRIKADNTFNGVYQAIPALYNPQFTKYTPGATNFERIVLGQWNNNVAEIGTQAGGTGALRPLRLIGQEVQVNSATFASLATCNSTTEGSFKSLSDSTTNTWGATVTGGGSNHVMAYCDGTNWTVMAN